MRKIYYIEETGTFVKERPGEAGPPVGREKQTELPEKIFDQLRKFADSGQNRAKDGKRILKYSSGRSGLRIQVQNYVGLITLPDRTVIEILPKICAPLQGDDEKIRKGERLVAAMLRSCRDLPFRTLKMSGVGAEKTGLLEIFIRMFLEETARIAGRGLRCGYEETEGNERYLKGRLKFPEHIRYNLVNKEKSYVRYDDYRVSRPENRLLKSCLLYLGRWTSSSVNRTMIRRLLEKFHETEPSQDIQKDFGLVLSFGRKVTDRSMKDYEAALLWSRVFLGGGSFTPYTGEESAPALLFPMEILYEKYAAEKIAGELDGEQFEISVQDEGKYLFKKNPGGDPEDNFGIRPDMIITRKCDSARFIVDTKWKVLFGKGGARGWDAHHYGIKINDMYQMFGYHMVCGARCAVLLYPYVRGHTPGNRDNLEFDSELTVAGTADGDVPGKVKTRAVVKVRFLDLFDMERSMEELKEIFYR